MIKLPIKNDTSFLLQYFYPENNHSDSWKIHNGLSGHIAFSERHILQKSLRDETIKAMDNIIREGGNHLQSLSHIYSSLATRYASQPSNTALTDLRNIDMTYSLISGFSRSGGTYLLSEYAKILNQDIQAQHLHWTHDFFPHFNLIDFFHHHKPSEETQLYMATLLAHALVNHENHFFRRTTLGASVIPWVQTLNHDTSINIYWGHCIRDIHGIILSLEKMYADLSEQYFPQHKILFPRYGLRGQCESLFGTYCAVWMVANLTILPIHRYLPLMDIPINMNQKPKEIMKAMDKSVDNYLKIFRKIDTSRYIKPSIFSFGSQLKEQCQHYGAQRNPTDYSSGDFHYSQKKESDDPMLPVFYNFLSNLTRLYQHFGFDFNGKLERV